MPMRWQSPPPPQSGRKPGAKRPKYALFADQLKARPGEWAILGDRMPTALAWQIENGKVIAFQPTGTFEAVCRKRPADVKGRGTVYVRFVGDGIQELDVNA